MPEKTFKAAPGDEIIIEVARARKSQGDSSSRRVPQPKSQRGALIKTRRTRHDAPRRLQKSGIAFYDLAQIKSGGAWITKDVSVLPLVTVTNDGNPANENDYVFIVASMEQSEADAVIENLLSVGVENFAATYRKVSLSSVGAAFPVSVSGDGFTYENTDAADTDKFKNGSLHLSSGELAGSRLYVSGAKHFLEFDLYASKITAEFDPDAEPVVDWRLKATADIFLIPAFYFSEGYSRASFPGIVRKVALNLLYGFVPRYFDEPDAIIETTSGALEAANRMQAAGTTRTFTFNFYFDEPHDRGVSGGGSFPQSGDGGFSVDYSGAGTRQSNLLALVRQDNTFFYVWYAE